MGFSLSTMAGAEWTDGVGVKILDWQTHELLRV